MVIRTRTGVFYEAFSVDKGSSWTEPVKTRFHAPHCSSLAGLCSLGLGRQGIGWMRRPQQAL